MDRSTALDAVETVEVSATEKKQLDQYEPATAHVSYTASVPEGEDPTELRAALMLQAQEDAKRSILRRWEEYIRKSEEDETDT